MKNIRTAVVQEKMDTIDDAEWNRTTIVNSKTEAVDSMHTSCSALNVICATTVQQYYEFIKRVSPIRANDGELDKDINKLNNTGKTAAERFYNDFILKFSLPGKIFHYQGKEFDNSLFKYLAQFCNIKRIRTSPFHPQINSQTERMDQTMINMLKTLAVRNKSMKDKSKYEKLNQQMSVRPLRKDYNLRSKEKQSHCVKCVRTRSYSGPYFPAFGLNTERYSVSLRIQSECGK